MSKVAVVILNYNGRNYLERFLPALVRYSSNAEIVVADNASVDSSISFLNNSYSSIRSIELDKNYGFAGGYNKALKEVASEYFVLLNSDVEVTADWLDPLIRFLDQHADYVACQPKILDFNRKDYFEYAGAGGGFIDSLGYPFCRGRIFGRVEKDSGQYNNERNIAWASGACLVIRSNVFFELGGFDADFFAHMEEVDLCWRAWNKNLKIRCIPSSIVYHVGGGTLSTHSPFKTYLNFRNGIFLILKNMSFKSLLWKLPSRVLLDWVAVLHFAWSGTPQHSVAIIKAHFSVITRFGSMIRKRQRSMTDPTTPFSIIFKYVVQQKKNYSDL